MGNGIVTEWIGRYDIQNINDQWISAELEEFQKKTRFPGWESTLVLVGLVPILIVPATRRRRCGIIR